MPPTAASSRWRVIASTQQGAAHVRRKLPNQDAVKWFPEPSSGSTLSCGGPPVILAVADGHGSAKSFRSKTGADFAVDVAMSVCREFLKDTNGIASKSAVKNLAEQQLPNRIVAKWKEKVKQDFDAEPFRPDELERLEMEAGAIARETLQGDGKHVTAYGSTLLLAAIGDEFILYLQIGDGEILVVSDEGEVFQPIDRDPTLIANETTSLCMDKPEGAFRFRFQHLHDTLPAIVLLSTDGYPNSFRSREDFLKVGPDLLDALRTDGGGDQVQRDLGGWLQEATTAGSGDDVTVGVIYRLEPPLGRFGRAVEDGQASVRLFDPPKLVPAAESGQNSEGGEDEA